MALIDITISSQVLEREVDLLAILPEDTRGMIGMGGADASICPTLYLLHGMSDDHTIWLRRTSIERYAAEKGLAVIMPCADLSFYTDQKMGDPFWTFITEELPSVCQSLFPQLSPRREDTYVAGLSMGGYGALKCGLRAYNTFSYAAGLSSVADVSIVAHNDPKFLGSRHYWEDIYGDIDAISGSFDDLFAAGQDYAKKKEKPPIHLYMWCGTEDALYSQNVKLKKHLQKLKLDLTYEESPGTHSWACWDEKIQTILNWLPLGKEEE
ncbi:MAG: esterase family protein [Clostridia bacterium]|nr:esterase family protein [Clostridia bacterium]